MSALLSPLRKNLGLKETATATEVIEHIARMLSDDMPPQETRRHHQLDEHGDVREQFLLRVDEIAQRENKNFKKSDAPRHRAEPRAGGTTEQLLPGAGAFVGRWTRCRRGLQPEVGPPEFNSTWDPAPGVAPRSSSTWRPAIPRCLT